MTLEELGEQTNGNSKRAGRGQTMAGILEASGRGLQRRSEAEVEFFVAHGYFPEIPIPGTPVDTSEWSGWSRAEEKRLFAGRSEEDKEFLCAHGHWPGERENGNS
jgi:hypothetical protein